ncbi:MAG: ImmA/IrrE family metallo-endopeptidase [Nanoarchaeota archaeon]|nr:ImmA/IrrE family metallo-endopeptidase [Nanoarchaeota archaeon]MBU1321699.1 ImmA/IrrE family metallo-endopeptidase [Nanoarchaeota archaeon]MBU1597279.1 ImmA/IrrE family metallo-endopeptidase [Nanoarchaeota archaeon]MBU2442243.1 ImmA/IrrE family metallo-endopeptidase [Nanoarchaeota archaeon]
MPKKSPVVDIELSVLKWLIDSSGWTNEEMAKRLGISTPNIQKIIAGEKKPTFKQLQELSGIFKRPVAAFLLSKPKYEKPKPKDYRLLPEKADKFDKKTLLVLRKTRRLQKLSKELSRNIKYETKTKLEKAKISDSPEKMADKYRELFELTLEKQKKFKTAYELFNYLRDVLEDMNIYVFQFSMPVEDARGFVLVDDSPNIIVVNTKDSIEARLFSLIHEFGHILLGESVIDLPDVALSSKDKIESWCNAFSASFLLPKPMAKDIFIENKAILTQRKTLNYLSRKYKVSKAMLLLSMTKLDFIQKKDYENILNQFKPDLKKEKEKVAKGGGGVSSDRKTLAEMGNKFISLVAHNYDREFITYTDALNYLSIKSKNFDKVLAKAKK